jgi:hypothetical protein
VGLHIADDLQAAGERGAGQFRNRHKQRPPFEFDGHIDPRGNARACLVMGAMTTVSKSSRGCDCSDTRKGACG